MAVGVTAGRSLFSSAGHLVGDVEAGVVVEDVRDADQGRARLVEEERRAVLLGDVDRRLRDLLDHEGLEGLEALAGACCWVFWTNDCCSRRFCWISSYFFWASAWALALASAVAVGFLDCSSSSLNCSTRALPSFCDDGELVLRLRLVGLELRLLLLGLPVAVEELREVDDEDLGGSLGVGRQAESKRAPRRRLRTVCDFFMGCISKGVKGRSDRI